MQQRSASEHQLASLTCGSTQRLSNRCRFCLPQFALLKENTANSSAGIVLVVLFRIRLIMDRDPTTMCFRSSTIAPRREDDDL